MGYKRNPKVYRLKFADGDYEGLEVAVRSISMGQLIKFRTGGDDEKDATEEMVELLAERIVEWNLEDETGTPIPPTLDAMKAEDSDFIMAIINQWTDAVAGVKAPLDETSNSGVTSPVASIPTEALSPSLAS